MPMGYQERFHYGEPMRASGTNRFYPGGWSYSGTPLIGYDALYGYRSGASAKQISTQGSYEQNVLKGKDLRSKLEARTAYLNGFINDSFKPQNGAPTVFSNTDVGHPFATFQVRTHQPYGHVSWRSGSYGADWDAFPNMTGLPFPDLTNPFGLGFRTGSGAAILGKQAYFAWPTTLFGGGFASPVNQQTYPLSLKQTLGTGLIAGTNPWKSKADLAVTIGELMTGNLPRILSRIGDSLLKLKIDWKLQTGKELGKHVNPGNEWLSLWFGWAPLVRDIMAAIEVLYKLHVLIYDGSDSDRRRFQKGDLVAMNRLRTDGFTDGERRFNFGSPFTGLTSNPAMKDYKWSGFQEPLPLGPLIAEGVYSRTVNIRSDFRFTARFHRGALPNAHERSHLDKALELLGLDITPATLYQLAPWSWLLDWFSSLGNAVQNLSTLDWSNVLLDYSYLTVVVKTITTSSVTAPSSWGSGQYSMSTNYMSQRVVQTEKIREQASPYGFSVSWAGLSPFQLSILAALGMTRGR